MSSNAHTDGDALVHWTRANVLHMGDTYFNGMLPFIDLEFGRLDRRPDRRGRPGLDMANDADRDHPRPRPGRAQAPTSSAIATCSSTCATAIGQGIARGQTPRRAPGRGPRQRYGRDSDFITPAAFTEAVYRSLMREVAGVQDDHHH